MRSIVIAMVAGMLGAAPLAVAQQAALEVAAGTVIGAKVRDQQGQELAVPWEAVKVQRDGNSLVVTVQHDVLEQAPRPQDRRGGDPAASPSTGQKK